MRKRGKTAAYLTLAAVTAMMAVLPGCAQTAGKGIIEIELVQYKQEAVEVFEMLEEKWDEFCEKLKRSGESGAAFLSMVKKVEVKEERLLLQVENSFYEGWLQEWENLREGERLLRSYVICPADMRIEIQSETDWERVKKIRGKLNRRYGNDEI